MNALERMIQELILFEQAQPAAVEECYYSIKYIAEL
jgi:hypothetical protein